MGTRTRTLAILLAGHAALFGTWAAHAQSSPVTETSLNETLYRTVCERVQTPLVFSTRDTLFALSLPADEPAEIYLQLTVGKNGKVKDKLTKVHANHIANYVAPAFAAATEELRIDRELLAGMQSKDTSLILTFPMEYQCVLDTVMRVWPESGEIGFAPFYRLDDRYTNAGIAQGPQTIQQRERNLFIGSGGSIVGAIWDYWHSDPSRVWYYLAFIHEPE